MTAADDWTVELATKGLPELVQHYEMLGVGNLTAPYADEMIIGYEEQLFTNTSVELSYVTKKTRSLMEDTCNNNSWIWGDGDAPDINDPSTWPDPGNCDYYVLANIPGLRRDYRGYIAKFETHLYQGRERRYGKTTAQLSGDQ